MKVSKDKRRAAKKLFRECFVGGKLDEKRVRDVVSAVATGQPRGYLGILSEIEKLVRIDFQKRTVLVESATSLSEPDIQNIHSKIRNQSKDSLHFTNKVNPS